MIGGLVALLSLNMTAALFNAGQATLTLPPITGATATTPITVTSPAHGVPLGRNVHAVVQGVQGTVEANAMWELTPIDANTLSLGTYDAQGNPVPSQGVNPYTGGGTINYAFPGYRILLGREFVAMAEAVATPRIVFVPTDAKAYGFEPYAGLGPAPRQQRGSAEQQAMTQSPQAATDFLTFEVYVSGAAVPPSPSFGDFDATQLLAWTLYNVAWEACGDGVNVLHVSWPSQVKGAGSLTQRGQQTRLIYQFQQPVITNPLAFVPSGTSMQLTVTPAAGGSGDSTIIVIPPEA